MTLNQILYFQKIANLENYHQAAEELYISQPSLSRSMASLENELGVTLLVVGFCNPLRRSLHRKFFL